MHRVNEKKLILACPVLFTLICLVLSIASCKKIDFGNDIHLANTADVYSHTGFIVESEGGCEFDIFWEWNGYSSAHVDLTCKSEPSHTERFDAEVFSAQKTGNCSITVHSAVVTVYGNVYTECKEQVLNTPNHNLTDTAPIEPTCTKNGLTAKIYCTVCGEVITPSAEIACLGHSYTSEEIRAQSSSEWRVIHECKVCSHSYEESGTRIETVFLQSGELSDNGTEIFSKSKLRSNFLPVSTMRISLPSQLDARLFFYNEKGFILSTSIIENDIIYVADYAPENATVFRVSFSLGNASDVTTATKYKDKIYFDALGEFDYSVRDVAETEGAYNALLRFEQLINVEYTPQKDIPQQHSDLKANVTKNGIPYSSTRPEALFVPNNVSLYTFVSALTNPNSYIYSIDLGEPPYNNVNGNTYYGAVCSTSAAYALGIEPNYTTHQWAEIPGMKKIDFSDARNLRVCDTIVGNGHVVMVTAITRNINGDVESIEISEAVYICTSKQTYSLRDFEARFSDPKFVCVRYEFINDVTYTPSPYVSVGDETPSEYTIDLPIISRKGDKSNWLYGMTVELDVLKGDGYSEIALYKDDILEKTFPISDYLAIDGLEAGYYSVCLKNQENESPRCLFAVVDAISEVENAGASTVKVTFSSSIAEPVWVQWADSSNGTVHVSVLSKDEADSGVAYCSYKAGSYKIRVAFRTEYGIIHSELPSAITLN